MDYQEMYDKIWNFMIEKVQTEVQKPGMNPNKLSQKLDVSSTAIYRWLQGDRGKSRIGLLEVLKIIDRLEVPMEDIGHLLSPELFKLLIPFIKMGDEELLGKVADIIEAGGPPLDKLKQEIEYLHKTMPK